MCSFLLTISTQEPIQEKITKSNNYIKSRGPNHTNIINFEYNGKHINAIHNLLDISGSCIVQPLFKDLNNLLLFNGEIYTTTNNYPDTLNIYQKLIKNSLIKFLRESRGEFAICSLDLKKNSLSLYSDLIGTKPLFYGFSENIICISSYEYPLDIFNIKEKFEVQPNSFLNLNYEKFTNLKIEKQEIYSLDIRQNIDHYELWKKSFLQSVKEKATHFNSKICVPLSSGYDSGAICCALNTLNIPYETITVGDSEDKYILKKRIKINKKNSCIKHTQIKPLTKFESKKISNFIKEKLGDIKYTHLDGENNEPISLHEDGGAIGLACLCEVISNNGLNVILSGSGADEIISDYGFNGKKIYEHSQFGGLFPENLEGFFPWKKFYGDTQKSYLKKDEMISGLFGIEGRYPFLDVEVVQNFLNLSSDLKNKRYKACIASLLDELEYPYKIGKKDGFYPEKSEYNFFEKVYRKTKYFISLLNN